MIGSPIEDRPLPSLSEAYRTVAVPKKTHPWRRLLAFAGPGYLVSVGYMDPGNWGTDIAGGAKYGYALLWVILASNLMAILLQTLCVRLGLVTEKDLAQACRDYYKKPAAIALWLLCEVAIIACDLAMPRQYVTGVLRVENRKERHHALRYRRERKLRQH